jgi:hypothetical protein
MHHFKEKITKKQNLQSLEPGTFSNLTKNSAKICIQIRDHPHIIFFSKQTRTILPQKSASESLCLIDKGMTTEACNIGTPEMC